MLDMPEEAFLYLKLTNEYFDEKIALLNYVGFIETTLYSPYTYNGTNYFFVFENFSNNATYVLERLYQEKHTCSGHWIYDPVPIDVAKRSVMIAVDLTWRDKNNDIIWVIQNG